MDTTRGSGLPKIKCSTCAVDIDILELADHVCTPIARSNTAPRAPNSPPSPSKLDRAATFAGASFSKRTEGQPSVGRMRPPPRIDSNAANKPFRPLEPSIMPNGPRSHSPMLPSPPKSPFKMNRSVTTPVTRPRLAPPSPTLPSNLDCAFPPFPAKRSGTPQSAKPQTRDRLEPTIQQQYAPASPLFAPLSPRVDAGDNITKRMDSIAPGPFDGRADRRPSTSNGPNMPLQDPVPFGHRRTATQGSSRSFGSIAIRRTSVSSTTSRASAYSNRSIGLPAHPKVGLDASMMPPPLPSKPRQNEGIDAFLDRLQKESRRPAQARQDDASNMGLMRQGSADKKEPPLRPRRPSDKDLPSNDIADLQPSAFLPRSDSMYPARNASLGGQGGSQRRKVTPPRPLQPAALLPPSFGSDAPLNPIHTPSDSGLSDDSFASSGFRSIASSRSSPAGSEGGHSRQASKISRSEYLDEAIQRTNSPESYIKSQPTPPRHEKSRGPQNFQSPPRSLSPSYADVPESPMDPAIQVGITSDQRPRQLVLRHNQAFSASRQLPVTTPRRLESRPVVSKGKCRGCSEPIIGKSVKDSSGRLTGRYHKQCFVCRTCSDPFPTAEFYVFENSPYCERHYHELNGSMCTSCDRGIEGQYLETDARQKFHPRCFTCATCRVVLAHDYYEVGGQKYCERHGRSAAMPPRNFLGPGGYQPRMEKRRTRLMMMV
ncbi:hypothetical protein GQ44DRAFT_615158 [Phaeosphaeriaceae sp. PMI808]|nr:hypothetical protein GQ44DRAFT_615158 [Phaeosphaeriaceae sp. PMI808]